LTSDVKKDDSLEKNKVSRRNFIIGVAAGAAVAAVAVAGAETLLKSSSTSPVTTTVTTGTSGTSTVTHTVTTTVTQTGSGTTSTSTPAASTSSVVTLSVNGQSYTLNLDNRWSLASALRYKLNLIGTKLACDRGECGACAVLVGGTPMLSCTMLAVEAQGKTITTIEGLGGPENLSPVQAALCDSDGIQCGACTPGVVVVATAFLKANPSPTQAALANALAGNLCKCGNWPHIFAGLLAVKQA